MCELKVHMQVKPRKPFIVPKQRVRFSSILGDPGADSGGEGKSRRAEK